MAWGGGRVITVAESDAEWRRGGVCVTDRSDNTLSLFIASLLPTNTHTHTQKDKCMTLAHYLAFRESQTLHPCSQTNVILGTVTSAGRLSSPDPQ